MGSDVCVYVRGGGGEDLVTNIRGGGGADSLMDKGKQHLRGVLF